MALRRNGSRAMFAIAAHKKTAMSKQSHRGNLALLGNGL